MAIILSIETATKACSVAISQNNKILSVVENIGDGYSHAENLSVFIEKSLTETDLKYADIDAVAISKGPGSYTGLRIGTSTAKGLCFALDIPLISVSTLQAMAIGGKKEFNYQSSTLFCPMIDARRMEVYSAFFNSTTDFIRETQADIIDENSYLTYLSKSEVVFFGDGAEKCKETLSVHDNAHFIDGFHPSAQYMVGIACDKFTSKQFEDTAYFEPYYLKDFVAGKPKKLI
ncbi:MAG: tRNA (adenosine(37)-N6)-threonylcarbamoyltransferase complex dimerization subunit type 1 TsaB [Flavobacteriales bacterium]|nr:tRNA (adenosine(37)-N6)-threonylcarbamoyltransferase complex dimerization subunit type 1 TsaB [Flavobacteriales bacterium]